MVFQRLISISALVAIPFALAAEPWRGWDDYHAILWSVGSPRSDTWYRRLRQIDIDGEQCPRGESAQPMLSRGMNFYVENLVPELGFLNNRAAIYQADWNGYTATQDKQYLTRKPCFHDPAFLRDIGPKLQANIRLYAKEKPLLQPAR